MIKPLLFGKSALIMGICKGAGKKIAYMLAKAGATVILNYHASGKDNAEAIVKEINGSGGTAIAISTNPYSTDAINKLLKQIEEYTEGIDILVNYTDTYPDCNIYTDKGEQHEQKSYNASALLALEAIITTMKKKHYGRIINITSQAQHNNTYATNQFNLAANNGILNFTYYYASKLAQHGITINTITPAGPDIGTGNALYNKTGLTNTQHDIADMTLLLACNGYVSGQTINIGQYPQAS